MTFFKAYEGKWALLLVVVSIVFLWVQYKDTNVKIESNRNLDEETPINFPSPRAVSASFGKTENGVRFAVENVQIGKKLKPEMDFDAASNFVKKFYEFGDGEVFATNIRNEILIKAHGSFLDIAYTALINHLPLIIRPDDIWLLLVQALARHIDTDPEAARSQFVKHKGRMVLVVKLLAMPESTEEWEQSVFSQFSSQIRQHIGDGTHSLISERFSTTTHADRAAFEIILMSAMKHYFEYKMLMASGIPWIELRGTLQDWISIRDRAKKMFGELMPDYASILLPVLDEFISSFQGNVNHVFWQGMVKTFDKIVGSGGQRFQYISGWINILFPYLKNQRNSFLKSWDKFQPGEGPELTDFPVSVSSVRVEVDDYGKQILLHFHAGAFGFSQDPSSLALMTNIGWVVSRDPIKQAKDRIAVINEQLESFAKTKQTNRYAQHFIDQLEKERATLEKLL